MKTIFCIIGGILISFFIEQLLIPKPAHFWKRPISSLQIHIGIWMLLFSMFLLLFHRPCFSAALVNALFMLIIMVSNSNFKSLKEPFIYQHFEYFIDVLKHPLFFLPFFGFVKAIICLLIFIFVVYFGLTIEKPMIDNITNLEFLIILLFLLISILMFIYAIKHKPRLTFNPSEDLQKTGLITILWCYFQEELNVPSFESNCAFNTYFLKKNTCLPDIVIVQNESFFDIRRTYSFVKPNILENFYKTQNSSITYGCLEVPAWGANTVRTEFSFLTGIPNDSLGVHKFNPYRKIAVKKIDTIGSFLKRYNYNTVCLHPYHIGFYNRKKVYPNMGFDNFIDIKSFDKKERVGNYIGDIPLAKKILKILNKPFRQPLFLFVITIENHGPLHLEKTPERYEEFYYLIPPYECSDMHVYLRHLSNSDSMIEILIKNFEALPNDIWFCWYGDHVPIMPNVYKILGEPDGKTDYLIWKKGINNFNPLKKDLKVEELSCLLLKYISNF